MTSTGRLTLADLLAAHGANASEVVVEPHVAAVPAAPAALPAFRRGSQAAASSEVKVFRPCSEKKATFLRTLVAERRPETDPAFTESVIAAGDSRVSEAITKLKAMPKVASAPAKPRVNRYPGTCEHCGVRVEAEAGTLTMSDEGKWEVAHADGECPASDFPFPVGRYALDTADGVRFFLADHTGFFFQAGDEYHPVAAGPARSFIAEIAADPEAASRLYGQEIGRCGRCNRTLTDEVSRAAGIGPVCASKGW